MRVCPKCGYVESLSWRHSLKVGIDWMPLSEFEYDFPELVEFVKNNKYFEKHPFVYHLTKGLNVERQAIFENPTYAQRWHIPIECGRPKGGKMSIVSKIMLKIKEDKKKQQRLLECQQK